MKTFLIFFLFPVVLAAQIMKVGDNLPTFTYTDQHDQSYTINSSLQTIVFVSDMEASKKVHKVLEAKKGTYLQEKRAILVADIHKMPSLISKLFAIPKMRNYKYPIYLIKEEEDGKPYPREKEGITLISLADLKVTGIQYLKTPEELAKFLQEK
ncbi:MAG: hypothetical protein H7A23_02100 [Leptospiraceae bacterium]|nr:hypothetical protein [Leptospiraceae bacterium]MCP5493322.1 hypothetical protein [Leptospiraceae bacterium]